MHIDIDSGAQRVELVKKLVQATGISEAQADDLVTILGTDWSSLMREARDLKRR